ncbi:MAG TPA: DUF1491 family protein [Sphingomicrobium sp.]|nr:DUF1491 family protein [Sphingomicrobium sp.]
MNASVEVSSLIRKAEGAGDFGVVLRKGDADSGSILVIVRSRGRFAACLQRTLGMDGTYNWGAVGPEAGAPEEKVSQFLAGQAGFDPDLWLVELDIAQPERFIAETTLSG